MKDNSVLIRHIHYKIYIEEFIISSLVAILGIRLFLKFTNYPQIGGEGLHISHMLWGGLLMLIAIVLLLTFLNNGVRRISTVIGGLGFGTFIDEIGKFVTSDNNYFFQPTFALIYLVFIIFYLVFHFLDKRREFTEKEYVVNSIEIFKDAVINDLDRDEKALAVRYLSRVRNPDEIVDTLSGLYKNIETIKPSPPNIFTKIRLFFKEIYFALISKPWFKTAVIVFFLFQALVSVIVAIFILLEKNASILPAFLLSHSFSTTSYNTIHLYTTLASLLFIIIGISRIYTSRLSAYIFFKRSILISILITQFFAFYYNPMNAMISLFFNIFMLISLNYMIENEIHYKRKPA